MPTYKTSRDLVFLIIQLDFTAIRSRSLPTSNASRIVKSSSVLQLSRRNYSQFIFLSLIGGKDEDEDDSDFGNPVAASLQRVLCLSLQAADVKEFSLYVHENRAPLDPSLIVVATATGNLTQIGFGTIQVFSNVLTSGPSINSTAIGVEPGFVSIGKQNIFISYTFTLNLPEGNGTLAVQGQFALNVWPRELAVVGGTGIFRYASGYDISDIVDDSNPADYVTIHKIYLKFL